MYYIDKSLHIISIHALRKECDYFYADNVIWVQISIHALRKECDLWFDNKKFNIYEFLSTHSVRSATLFTSFTKSLISISIHALRKECDQL